MMLGMLGPSERVAVVAHDAGAANVIFSWIAAEPGAYRIRLEGPAAMLWGKRFGSPAPALPLGTLLDGATCLISGTGWASTFEHCARRAALDRGITSFAVLDHWVNYRARFVRHGETVLPDRLLVTDDYAAAVAREELPEVPIEQWPNLYLAEQVAAAGEVWENGDLLFVSEPARSDWGQGVPGEFQALDYLATYRDVGGIDPAAMLRIRPHPSDPPGKYDAWVAAHPGSGLDHSCGMGESLRRARWVAGLQSYALVIALASGRSTICALPPASPPNRLPHHGLVHLRDRVAVMPQRRKFELDFEG